MLRRKILAFLLSCFWFLQLFPLNAACAQSSPIPVETSAVSALIMEPYSGKIIYEKELHKRVAPASVTKVMTLLLSMEAIKSGKVSLEDRVVASEAAWKLGGSQIWLEPGEEFSLSEMLIAIAVGSANDACMAVAEHIAGSHEVFVEMMNQKVKTLGLKNTHFVNAYGLPAEGHYTSAYDMAQICREFLKHPELMQLTSTKTYDKLRNGNPILNNTNKLLWWYEGTDGFKTGWTLEANYCLASTVKRGNLRLFCCVFGVPEKRGHFHESIKLYNWAFANYAYLDVASPEKSITSATVGKGIRKTVEVGVPKQVGVLVKKGEDVKMKTAIELSPLIDAPIMKGDRLGKLIVLVDGKVVDEVPLVAENSVPKASFWKQFKRSFESFVL